MFIFTWIAKIFRKDAKLSAQPEQTYAPSLFNLANSLYDLEEKLRIARKDLSNSKYKTDNNFRLATDHNIQNVQTKVAAKKEEIRQQPNGVRFLQDQYPRHKQNLSNGSFVTIDLSSPQKPAPPLLKAQSCPELGKDKNNLGHHRDEAHESLGCFSFFRSLFKKRSKEPELANRENRPSLNRGLSYTC